MRTLPPHRRSSWRSNWTRYEHLTKEMREWFYNSYLMGGKSLKALIIASPRSAARILRNLCDWERQFDAGFVCPIKPVIVFSEELDTELGANEVNCWNRFHRYSQTYQRYQQRRWKADAADIVRQMDELRSAIAEVQAEHPFLELPDASFLDPNDPEGRDEIRRAADRRLAERRPPFDMILSGPYGRWIGRALRLGAGEIAEEVKTPKRGPKRFRLRRIEVQEGVRQQTNCFGWVPHPVGPTGGQYDLAEYGGSQAFHRLVEKRATHARIALMGLGPRQMDDPSLLAMQTPAEALGIDYQAGKRTNATLHRECSKAVEFYYEMIDNWMFGASPEESHQHDHLGIVIARHIVTMFHAWKQDPKVHRCVPKRVRQRSTRRALRPK